MIVPPVLRSDEPTDERLMLRSAAGDREAFGSLVERHHQSALNLAYRLSGDPELSRDVVQESFLRILRAAHRYEARARFSTVLFTVVRNMVREVSRGRRRRREEPLQVAANDDDDPPLNVVPGVLREARTPESILEEKEVRGSLMMALNALSEELRAVFVLSEIEGLSYRDVARICGCPIGTVASRKHAAVARLREILRPVRGDV